MILVPKVLRYTAVNAYLPEVAQLLKTRSDATMAANALKERVSKALKN